MPEEIPYRRQVRTQPAAAMPLTRPDDYGAGLAGQVAQAATSLDRERLENYQLDRKDTANAEWARFQHDFGLGREDMDRITQEGRKDDSPGHVQRMRGLWQPKLERMLEGITEDEVRQRATASADEWTGRYLSTEGNWAEAQRINRTLTDAGQAQNISANRMRNLTDAQQFPAELQIGHDFIDGLDLPPDVKRKAHTDWDSTAGVSYLRGLSERDPAQVRAQVDAGLWEHLDPDTVNAILNGADVELRSRDVEARRVATTGLAALKEEANTLIDQAANGQPMDEDRLAEILPQLTAAGETRDAERVTQAIAANRFANIYEGATPRQREVRQIELAQKPDRTEAENRELDWLTGTKAGLDDQYQRDPVGFHVGRADAPPELDWDDPASVRARGQWATAADTRTPLTRAETRELATLWETRGRANQLEVLDRIAGFPAAQARAAAQAIDPNDRTLPFVVSMPESYRRLAYDGRDALKANPKLTSSRELEKTDPDAAEEIREYDRQFSEALGNVSAADRTAILTLANRLTAGAMEGDHTTELTPSRYLTGLNMALGGRRDDEGRWRGGLGRWGEHHFVLPEGVSAAGFGNAVRAFAAAGDGPVEADGKTPATLARAFPVMVRPGVYEFHTPDGGVLRKANDEVWQAQVQRR